MKKIFSFDKHSAILAFWLAIGSTFVLPANEITGYYASYGYPFGFFWLYPHTEFPPVPLLGVSIYPLDFLINVYLLMVLTNLAKRLIKRLKQKRASNTLPPQ